MARVVVLDSGPLGLLCVHLGDALADRCRAWLDALEADGARVVIPVVADFEVRRGLLRVGATAKLRRLDALARIFGRLDLDGEAADRAAAYWADLRRRGLPTAADAGLDGDAVIAGMAATCAGPGDVVTLATMNASHMTRFAGVDARAWDQVA